MAWEEIGSSEDECLRELLELYWEALEVEIADAILSLNHILQLRNKHPDPAIGPQGTTQRVSARLGEPVMAWKPLELSFQEQDDCKGEVEELSLEKQNVSENYLLARMILSGLSVFDIDEVIEYRDPPLPSQNGPPQFEATMDDGGNVDIISITCDICDNPIRGMSWKCSLGCTPTSQDASKISDPVTVCLTCYTMSKHPKQHLVPCPHRYAISPELQAVLSREQFWHLRREIQRHQDNTDLEQDRKTVGVIWNAVVRKLSSWARSDEKFPLGNIHASIMFGPLVFETGVRDSKNGVRMSCRRPPNLGKRWSTTRHGTILALDPNQHLHKANGWIEQHPIQAVIKQVVGGAFSGYHPHLQQLEDLVIKMLLAGAENWAEQPLKSRQANEKNLRRYASNIITVCRFGMEDHVRCYLKALTSTLFDPNVNLRWDKYDNNCQNFCDALLQRNAFAKVLPPRENLRRLRTDPGPCLDYVISFRTDPDLGKAVESTKLSIGPLTAFLKQIHRPTNVLEYQESRGRINSDDTPLCARIFGWRCQSEDCDLADHAWTNPAELVSMLQFHLMMDRSQYPPTSTAPNSTPLPLTDIQWVKNRLAVLQALDSFLTSAASITQAFQNRLESDQSQEWNPPKAPSIPQDLPFQYFGDEVQMQQEDPGPRKPRGWAGWLFDQGSSQDEPEIELPLAYTTLGERAVALMPTVGTALGMHDEENEAEN